MTGKVSDRLLQISMVTLMSCLVMAVIVSTLIAFGCSSAVAHQWEVASRVATALSFLVALRL